MLFSFLSSCLLLLLLLPFLYFPFQYALGLLLAFRPNPPIPSIATLNSVRSGLASLGSSSKVVGILSRRPSLLVFWELLFCRPPFRRCDNPDRIIFDKRRAAGTAFLPLDAAEYVKICSIMTTSIRHWTTAHSTNWIGTWEAVK